MVGPWFPLCILDSILIIFGQRDSPSGRAIVTNLISHARIVGLRIGVFFRHTQLAQKCWQKHDILSKLCAVCLSFGEVVNWSRWEVGVAQKLKKVVQKCIEKSNCRRMYFWDPANFTKAKDKYD